MHRKLLAQGLTHNKCALNIDITAEMIRHIHIKHQDAGPDTLVSSFNPRGAEAAGSLGVPD